MTENRLAYELRVQIGRALDRLVCDDSTPEQVDTFIQTFADFGLRIVADDDFGPSPSPKTVGKAEAFDRIVAARKKHIDAGKAYNARRELVEAERSRGNWSIKLDAEYRAMSDAQSEYHRTVRELADAALTTEGQNNG